MALPYAVVSFIDDKDDSDDDEEVTSEVPSLWLTSDRNQCWWPNTKDLNTYITKRTPPQKNNKKWNLHNIVFEGFYETLETARRKAEDKKSDGESSSNQTENQVPYLRKRKQQTNLSHIREETSPSEDERHISIPDPPTLHKNKNSCPLLTPFSHQNLPATRRSNCTLVPPINKSPIRFVESSALHRNKNNDRLSQSLLTEDLPIDYILDNDMNFDISKAGTSNSISTVRESLPKVIGNFLPGQNLDETPLIFDGTLTDLCDNGQVQTRQIIEDQFTKLFKVFGESLVLQKSMAQQLIAIENKLNVGATTGYREDFSQVTKDLPLKDTAFVQMFEIKMADEAFRRIFVQFLDTKSGNSAKESILRMLRQVFDNSVAKKSSWCGLRNNLQISNLKVIAAIKDGVRLSFECKDKAFEEVVSEWFRQAGQRVKRDQKNAPQPRDIVSD